MKNFNMVGFQGMSKERKKDYAQIIRLLVLAGADPNGTTLSGYKPASKTKSRGGNVVYSTGAPGKIMEGSVGDTTAFDLAIVLADIAAGFSVF